MTVVRIAAMTEMICWGVFLIGAFVMTVLNYRHQIRQLHKDVAELTKKSAEASLARSWAAEVKDIEAAEDELKDALLAEENREMQAWNQFRQNWKSTWYQRHRVKSEGVFAPHPDDFSRKAFHEWYRSEKPMIFAKMEALRHEEQARRRGSVH